MTQTTLNLRDAMNERARTANGGLTNATSLNKNVDLFFLAGASRGKDISPQFEEAYKEDFETATRILLWTRDVRGGAGERDTFRTLFRKLILDSAGGPMSRAVLAKVPELGRWDDVLVTFDTELEREGLRMIAKALHAGDGLCAKWMPRPGKEGANKIRAYLKMTPKAYRQMLAGLSSTVEQKMCANEWDKITYSHVPSVAASRYTKAFGKHDPVGYAGYKTALVKGETKINAGAVYPYDVLKTLEHGDETIAIEQWKALPDYLNGTTENILPIVDTSGSMEAKIGKNENLSCLDVAVSLGLYLSERNQGIYKDSFITFSSVPEMVTLKGNLKQREQQLSKASWQQNTNIQAVFEEVLAAAVKHNIPEAQMPTKLIILSDMEFDGCVTLERGKPNRDSWIWGRAGAVAEKKEIVSAMDMIREQYAASGYKMPQLVFWNLLARPGNVPVRYDESGVALVSGFSPAIMGNILGSDLTPVGIMLSAVMNPRYDV